MTSTSRIDYTGNLSEEEGKEEKEVYPTVHKRKCLRKPRFAEDNFERASTTKELTSLYEKRHIVFIL